MVLSEILSVDGGSRALVAAVLLVLVGGTACSSTSSTHVDGAATPGGGSDGSGGERTAGSGGTGADSQGGSSSTSTGTASGGSGTTSEGGAASADCAAGKLLVPDLNAACIEDLGQGKLRFTYDFATTEQGQDFAPSTGATVSVKGGALVVVPAEGDTGIAIFKKQLHVNRASFKATLMSGTTLLWYVNTIWSGYWNPDAGYAGYHDYTGRGFIANGTEYPPAEVTPISVGVLQSNTIEQTDSELTWDQDGSVIKQTVAPLPVTDRIFGLGATRSSAAFYNVVFEGTLN